MRKSRFSEAQIVGILQELKAVSKAADLCRKHGISEATIDENPPFLEIVRSGI